MATNATHRLPELHRSPELRTERRIRLRADRHAPAAVRSMIRPMLDEAHLVEMADDVLLLATELTTNAVLHAGTDLDVTVDVDATRVHVAVADGHRGELPVLDTTSAMRRPLLSHGRGLILVDRIATRWGVVHDNSGKSVWFDISRGDLLSDDVPGSKRPTHPARGGAAQRDTPRPQDDLVANDGAVLAGPDTWLGTSVATDLAQFAMQLVGEVSAAAGEAPVELVLDRADGRGGVEVARAATANNHNAEPVRIPLPLAPPAGAELNPLRSSTQRAST